MKRILVLSTIVIPRFVLVNPAAGQVQREGFEGLACYADTTYGWEFGLTGDEVPADIPLKMFSACGPRPSREQVVELGNRKSLEDVKEPELTGLHVTEERGHDSQRRGDLL